MAVMRDGEVSQVGAPRDVYERPDSAYVASFLGVANLIRVDHHGDGVVAGVDGAVLRAADGRADVGACHVVIRPERIRLAPAGAAGADVNVVRARITKLVYVGPVTQVHLACGPIALQALVANDGAGVCGAVGDEVEAHLPPDAVRLLPG